ncbi:hypothetical protein, partial [Salmonella enterica]|uniref:hypothetical protein n=1 Tax=Salmonella enterica TaxID=28901 RepID=UPI003FA76395
TIYASAGSIGGIVMDANSAYSSNYVAGTTGFKLNSNGTIDASSVTLRGSINGGQFTAYAWPAAGAGGGFHLSATGLLLGNYNTYLTGTGGFFEVRANGDVSAPGLSIASGVATFGGKLTAQAIN